MRNQRSGGERTVNGSQQQMNLQQRASNSLNSFLVSGQINLSSSLEEKEFGDEEGKSALNDGVHFEMKQTFVLVLKLPSFQECFQAAVLPLFH